MADKKRQKFQMIFGMKEHPETGVLLFPGDVFELDPADIMKPPEFGGWLQRAKDPAIQKPEEQVEWILVCARRVSDSAETGLVMRDEPSQIIGVNITEKEYLQMERAREANEASVHPDMSVSRAAKNVPGVRRR